MADAAKQEPVITMWSKEFTYDRWMKSKGIPIHRGYFIEDLRTIELEWWEERGCKAAFIQLLGQEGVSASRVTEVPPGKSLPPVKFALDEIVYVLSGRGLTTVWANEGKPKKNFEWQALDVSSAAQSLACVQQHAGRQTDPAVSLQLYADGDVGVAGTGHVFQ